MGSRGVNRGGGGRGLRGIVRRSGRVGTGRLWRRLDARRHHRRFLLHADVHGEVLSGHQAGALQAVPALEVGYGAIVLPGDAAEVVAATHFVVLPDGLTDIIRSIVAGRFVRSKQGGCYRGLLRLVNAIEAAEVGVHLVHRKTQRLSFLGIGDDTAFVHRVEVREEVVRDVDGVGDITQGDLLVDQHRVDVEEIDHRRNRGEVVFAGVVHQVSDGDEGRYITACFTRQVWTDLPERMLATRAGDGAVDVAGSAVVRGDDQQPVVVDRVHVLEILTGGIGRLHRIASFVDEGVDLETVQATGRQHELPKARRADRRNRHRVERALHDGEVLEFERKSLLVEDLFVKREIQVGQSHHAFGQTALLNSVHVDVTLDLVIEGHRDGRLDAFHPLCVDVVVVGGNLERLKGRGAIGVGSGVHPLHEALVHQAVERCGDRVVAGRGGRVAAIGALCCNGCNRYYGCGQEQES